MEQRQDKRQFLMTGDSITLRKLNIAGKAQNNNLTEEFSIDSVIGKGGSSICYEASRDSDGCNGRLKEFYPVDLERAKQYFVLRRNNENQLIVPDETKHAKEAFLVAKEEFTRAYSTLSRVKNNKKYRVLNNYTSHFELYEGIPEGEDQPKTVYVWTSQDRDIKTFDEYLKEMREDIKEEKQPERHLFNILSALLSLTNFISALHSADLLHLDVKPSNFGLAIEQSGEVNPSNISMFDANTIYSAFSTVIRSVGTEGFCAPEIRDCKDASNRSDIYSLGASLFNSIVVAEDSGVLYKDEYYDELNSYISNSKLIKCSDANSNAALHDKLVDILKNCLAHNPKKRYPSCSLLANNLKDACALMLPAQAESALKKLGKKIKIEDYNKYLEQLDEEKGANATGAIQKLLYEHPLYDKDEHCEDINVLVLGAGTYAQKFIDIAFEVSQIQNMHLTVTAVSNKVEADKKRYLKSRPAFTEFFTVDGVSPEGESYGNLNFVSTGTKVVGKEETERIFECGNPEDNDNIICDLMLEDRSFSYIFVALGDDELNRCVAENCLSCSEINNKKSRIFFTWYGKEREFKEGITPVYVNNVIAETDYYQDLKRMALNCHMLWDHSLNIDLINQKAAFSSPYNFNASFSHVLSIKYKLHSVNIENMDDRAEAARAFAALCKKDKDTVNTMVQYEHRRWMVNNICQGWETLKTDDFYKLTTDTKIKKDKLHPCIVPSDSKWVLNLPEWKNNNHEKWDTASDEELAKLDALDRMSVNLHRHFKRIADTTKDLAYMQKYLDTVSSMLKNLPNALKVFNKFVLCMAEITSGKSKQTNQYKYYEKAVKKLSGDLPDEIRSEFEKQIKNITDEFYPILQSQKYIDFKSYDRDLVLGIPFILTYSTSARLCVPLGIEAPGENSNRILFGNIASSLVLNPSSITYVADAEEVAADKGKFLKSIKYILNCIGKRRMQAKINLLFLQPQGISVADNELKKQLKALSPIISTVETMEYDSDTQLKEKMLEYLELNQKNKRKCFSAIEKNSTGVSKLLRGLGCYEKLPSFRYNSVKCEFETDSRCEGFKYIENNDYLRVSDMFEFQDAQSSSDLPEMQADYKFFWNLYKSDNTRDMKQQNEKVWKKLCEILKATAEQNDLLLSIKSPGTDEGTRNSMEERTYFVPVFCRDAVEKLLKGLTEISVGFTGGEPSIVYHNSTTCRVTLKTTPAVFKNLEELFSNPYILCDASKIRVAKFNRSAKVYLDSLKVENLKKSSLTTAFNDNSFSNRLTDLLKNICENKDKNKYIVNYRETDIDGETYISFTYASPQIKQLLTNEGRILELYVYYKALEQNYFDDVANSCQIIWNSDNVSNEFDLVLTKGYKALIVECKARPQLEQDFYFKLAQLNQRFGINAVPVLVADTVEKPNQDNSVNDMQRSRGNELGVKTVCKTEEIISTSHDTGIGAALRKIIEGLA